MATDYFTFTLRSLTPSLSNSLSLTHSLSQTVAHHTQQREVCTVTREYTHTCSQRTFKLVARARLGRICPHLPRRPSLRRPFDVTLPSFSFSDLFGAGGLELDGAYVFTDLRVFPRLCHLLCSVVWLGRVEVDQQIAAALLQLRDKLVAP